MSGVQALNALATVIHRAMQTGRQTPMGLAVAVDSAQMLMCPETAEDLARLRKRVAELEMSLAMQSTLTWALNRVTELEQSTADHPEPSVDPCHPCGCPTRFNRHADGCPSEVPTDVSPQVATLRALLAHQAGERP